MTGFVPAENSIQIPASVSQVLEKLLRRRLFILDRGVQPRRIDHQHLNLERYAKTLKHRAGDQVYITLRGPGNCWAELRWNYSSKFLLPKFPWEEVDYTFREGENWNSPRRLRTDLKPLLDKLDFPRPARVVRSCDVLSDFQFTGAVIDKRNRPMKCLRFEKHVDLDQQVLETTEDLCLVIKAELSWLQIGTTFPYEGGARAFNVSDQYQGYPASVEEAVDYAIYTAMNSRRGENSVIHHKRDRMAPVASVGNPLSLHASANYYTIAASKPARTAQHQSWLTIHNSHEDYQNAFPLPSGIGYLLPEGLPYYLAIEVPENCGIELVQPISCASIVAQAPQTRRETFLPSISVTVLCDDKVIHEQSLGGPDHKGFYSMTRRQICYSCEIENLPKQAGHTVVTRITDARGTEEHTYRFVTLKAYEEAWDNWRNPIIEQYKRQILAAIAAEEGVWVRNKRVDFVYNSGDAVACLIDGRWLEATYVGTTKDKTHKVIVSDRCGKGQWEVSYVRPLVYALEAGWDVVAPYNPAGPVGTQSTFVGAVFDEAENNKRAVQAFVRLQQS